MQSVWASRSSQGYPLQEAERGVWKSHVYVIQPFEKVVALCISESEELERR